MLVCGWDGCVLVLVGVDWEVGVDVLIGLVVDVFGVGCFVVVGVLLDCVDLLVVFLFVVDCLVVCWWWVVVELVMVIGDGVIVVCYVEEVVELMQVMVVVLVCYCVKSDVVLVVVLCSVGVVV